MSDAQMKSGNTNVRPEIYRQPSEILPGDPREQYILVGSYPNWETIPQKRLRLALDRIAPMIVALRPGIDAQALVATLADMNERMGTAGTARRRMMTREELEQQFPKPPKQGE